MQILQQPKNVPQEMLPNCGIVLQCVLKMQQTLRGQKSKLAFIASCYVTLHWGQLNKALQVLGLEHI